MKNFERVPILDRLLLAYHQPFAAAKISPRMLAYACRSQKYPFIFKTVGPGVEYHFIEREFVRQIKAFTSCQSGPPAENWEALQPGLKLQVTSGVWHFKTRHGEGGFHELTDGQVAAIKDFFELE